MIPVEQRQLADPANGVAGDCWRACIASILELPYEQVPHFVAYGEPWWNETIGFLRSHGVSLWRTGIWGVDAPKLKHGGEPIEFHVVIPGYWIASVLSPRFAEEDGEPGRHTVVMYGDRIVWDPHPQRDLGHLGFDEMFVLVPGMWLGQTSPDRGPGQPPSGEGH